MPQRISSKLKIEADVQHVYDWAEEIGRISIDGLALDIWQMVDQNDIKLWFIKDHKILTELAFTLFGQGVKENLVIQGTTAPKGLARKIYVKYLLSKYQFILSDTTMTDQGFNFWKKLWKENKDRFKFYIYDAQNKTKVNLMDESQMDKVFGPTKQMHGFNFVIVK